MCLGPFGVTDDQLLCECTKIGCDYQYCNKCVQTITKYNGDKLFRCMYCGQESERCPQQNELLTKLLWQEFRSKYGVETLLMCNTPEALLDDISCRIIHIQSLIETINTKSMYHSNTISKLIQLQISNAQAFVDTLRKIEQDVVDIFKNEDDSDENDEKITDSLKTYVLELTGKEKDQQQCRKFIEICESLLYLIKQIEFVQYFPHLNGKLITWEDTIGMRDEFKPKVIDLFKEIEKDLNQIIVPSIPPRIGIIGQINSGKSSLLNRSRQITNDNDSYNNGNQITTTVKATAPNRLFSPIRLGQSTYCPLEFEHQYSNGKKVIYVDIQGSTDYDTQLKAGNYFDEIRKADCDVYIIVSETTFTDNHLQWKNYIENILKRQCLLVRNKVDELFLNLFEQDIKQDFDTFIGPQQRLERNISKIINRIRSMVKCDIHGNEISTTQVYLTFSSYKLNSRNRYMTSLSFAKFDIDKLIDYLSDLPLDFHTKRLQKLAHYTIARVINTCFRRGYVVSILKYKIQAGLMALCPFLELLSRYLGRESIRQAFGVNDRSRFSNWRTGQEDTFKEFLQTFNANVDNSELKTSAFKETFPMNLGNTETKVTTVSSIAVKGAVGAGSFGATLIDDAAGIIAPIGSATTRTLTYGLLAAGVVLQAGMCAWSAVANENQMYNYLNRLCDDLIYVSNSIILKIIEKNNQTRENFLEQLDTND
ncbi:unnamed protein product [Didymodactylos carnosus]|uniref:G domain-containing protein n=1 Tax=Didymodactylos carnosus TaxID=1234261 RepID=A0A815DCT9_9BILA|nr:unnamed protein product [Didymodactylos carnosus]CAF1299894.1 unnamed protein product [Didymodactylos carnosus]CAF3934589.1 unnamed protein product [Didymodactylos carnosus]CAF4121771.1 unnamed protein product [Didymodactylos carnosus]